ncbi:hypothetical protein GC105_11445 [Alkalibaculum sp. M08DMB]|uniref:Phage protein n=1 Tax=Alkalibaculum sporogenes TaxID=2655001 RepID=A0A6A7KBL2_9FIRM|nr:hypothetical protein [Alkalibaculum sporogenes]MPW26403.1 hypothetical protein [Alkalibaculum sporogenes]
MITKNELAAKVKIIFTNLREWQFREEDLSVFPRALYWGYARSSIRASGNTYEKTETVQISVFSKVPDELKVDKLEDLLIELGINTDIFVEFNENDKIFHYYTGVECERG